MPGQQAQQSLAAGRYRDAIGQFKDLLKSEVRPEWREGLAAAYRGRARELTEKGMLKEALIIWQNRQEACPGAPLAPEHVALVLRTGDARQAAELLHRGRDGLSPADQLELRGLLAVFHLTGPSGLEQVLAPDDPILAYGAAARRALEAYCAGDDALVEEVLRGLPFRSPYRDWSQVLRALLRARDDPAGARDLLQRVPPDSAFAPVQRAARLALLTEPEFLAALGQASEAERRFAAALRGWPEARLALWEELHKLGDPPPPFALLGLMHRHRQPLGEAWVRWRGLRLLTVDYPGSLHWPRRLGGKPLSPLQGHLVAAWHAEEDRRGGSVLDAWSDVIELIREGSGVRAGSDDALRIALIQRRLATHWRLLEGPLHKRAEALLEESLRLDPEERGTCLLLGAHYRKKGCLQDARRVLDGALGRWPDDLGVLTGALETAVAADAFKKAGGFARRILELDPINRRARQSLFEAHLSHARKQLKRRRADLARKELERAAEWANGAADEARRELLVALSGPDLGRDGGGALLASAVERLGGGMCGQLELAVEVAEAGGDPAARLRRAGLRVADRPQKADLLAFCRRVRERVEAGARLPQKAIELFQGAVKAGAQLDLSHQETEAVCETLRLQSWNAVRLLYARAALKRWPGEPVFELHALEAKDKGPFRMLSYAEVERAERASVRAREAGDARTAHRLDSFLQGPSPLPPFLDDDEAPMPGDLGAGLDDAELDALIEMLASGPMRGELKDLERRLGRKGMREVVMNMLDEILPSLGGPIVPPRWPLGPRRVGRPRKPPLTRPPTPPTAPERDAESPDDPDQDQPDLFK